MTFRTLWHSSSTDVGGHAAAVQVPRVVACHDLDLVAGEVVQVGDDSRLLGGHLYLQLDKRWIQGDQEVKCVDCVECILTLVREKKFKK